MTSASDTNNFPVHDAALCVFATGKYTDFLPKLARSAREFFLPGSRKEIVAFTDRALPGNDCDRLVFAPRLPWPLGTMLRYHFLLQAVEFLRQYRFVFMCDVDMEFLRPVGEEILGQRVATLNGISQRLPVDKFTYCRNAKSSAFISYGTGRHYYVGGFQGGESNQYLVDCRKIVTMIDADLVNQIIATWHDESYWNAFLLANPPTVELPAEYCTGEPDVTESTKIMAKVKDHAAYRQWDT